MHRTVFVRLGVPFGLGVGVRVGLVVVARGERRGYRDRGRGRRGLQVLVSGLLVLVVVGGDGGNGTRTGTDDTRIADERALLLPSHRDTRLLVFVIRVARGAARLLHLVLDHRHHGMVRDAALARTVVVQNVTEPKPALLH